MDTLDNSTRSSNRPFTLKQKMPLARHFLRGGPEWKTWELTLWLTLPFNSLYFFEILVHAR